VGESHEMLLGREVAAWRALGQLARRQGQAILTQQADRVAGLRVEMRAQLRLALLAQDEARPVRQELPEAERREREAELRQAQLAARDAVRLTLEVSRTSCEALSRAGSPALIGPRVVGVVPTYRAA
jgi:hypothetical protein